jgi:hypothetical protein
MRLAVVLFLLAACGDNQDPCGFHEADDADNGSAPENTGLAMGAAASVCGSVDGGHYDAALRAVDVDRYHLVVNGSGELLVELTADPDAALLGDVTVTIFDGTSPPTLVGEGALRLDLADHAAFVTQVTPGDVEVDVTAHAPGPIDGSLDYRLRLVADPGARCSAASGDVNYREAHDGDDDTGNDYLGADFARAPVFQPIGGLPEPTGKSIAEAQVHVAGSAGAEPRSDAYLDRDTYMFSTGDIDELGVHLDWTAAADLDFAVLEAATLEPVATSTQSGVNGPEFQVFAVRPRRQYVLWVGRFATPAGTDPAPYDVNLCPGRFY